ncbi:hypothetical protein V6R21_21455 [Limibacter armeniacum]|uniref:hypothetical protein n=1 Tax=Limibacter armeniacum TaxID=466084 RepID=UPI002FE65756
MKTLYSVLMCTALVCLVSIANAQNGFINISSETVSSPKNGVFGNDSLDEYMQGSSNWSDLNQGGDGKWDIADLSSSTIPSEDMVYLQEVLDTWEGDVVFVENPLVFSSYPVLGFEFVYEGSDPVLFILNDQMNIEDGNDIYLPEGSAILILSSGELDVEFSIFGSGIQAGSDNLLYSGLISDPAPIGGPLLINKDGNTVLPVELIYFSANGVSEGVQLSWATASEENNSHFEIERSTDGITYEKLGEVKGSGYTQMRVDYEFIDSNTPSGDVFYRLKQVDYNGQYEYFPLVYQDVSTTKWEIGNISNPTSGGFNIELFTPKGDRFYFRVIDQQGRILSQKEVQLSRGATVIQLGNDKPYKGFIVIQVISGNQKQVLKLFHK